MENIIGPVIINLEHRKDRWDLIVAEAERMDLKYTRFDAIRDEDGPTGCLTSHMRVLEHYLSENKPIFVVEDDLQFLVSKELLQDIIIKFIESPAELLCLGFNDYHHVDYDDTFFRTYNCQTSSAYIIKPSLIHQLLDIWKGVYEFRKTGKKDIENEDRFYRIFGDRYARHTYYCLDMSWKLLQQDHVVLIPRIRTAFQRASYSDIERRHVDYNV